MKIASLINFYNSLNPKDKVSANIESDQFLKKLSSHTPLFLRSISEKDLENFFNLVLLYAVESESFPMMIQNITKAFKEDEKVSCSVKLSILCNIFNKTAEANARFNLYEAIIQIAAKSNETDTILPNILNSESIISGLAVPVSDLSRLYLMLSQSIENNQELSFHFLFKYLKCVDSKSLNDDLKKHVMKAIKMAISIKSILYFQPLLSLQAIQSLGSSPQLEMLKILGDRSFEEFKTHLNKNPGLLKELGVADAEAYRKIRILALSKLASKNVGQFIQYETVASALDINMNQVEFWVIDGVRSRLVDAKLDQSNNTIFISRAPLMEIKNWTSIAEKLESCGQNLTSCLESL